MAIAIDQRYPSARGLAEDIERWLADELVLAYRDQESVFEKSGRWLRHHRGWAAGIALALIAVTVSTLIAGYFINEARLNETVAKQKAVEFKQDAVERYRVAKSALDTLIERSDALQDIEGAAAFREQLIEQAAKKYGQLALSQSDDPDLEIERARAMVRAADVHMLRVDLTSAAEVDQVLKEYDTVIELLSSANTASTGAGTQSQLLRQVELARTRSRRAAANREAQRIDQARTDFQSAIDLLKELRNGHPDSADVIGNLAIAYLNLASLEIEQGRQGESFELAQQSATCFNEIKPADEPLYAINLAKAHQLLERIYRQRNERQKAAENLDRANEIVRGLVRQDIDNPQLQEQLASQFVSAAAHAREYGDTIEAINLLCEAKLVYEQLAGRWGSSVTYRYAEGMCYLDLGILLAEHERHDVAMLELERANSQFTSLQGSFHRVALALHMADVADTAALCIAPFKPQATATSPADNEPVDRALTTFNEGVSILLRVIESESLSSTDPVVALPLARILSHRAQHHVGHLRFDEAKADFEQAVELLDRVAATASSLALRRQLAHTRWQQALMLHATTTDEQSPPDFKGLMQLWRDIVKETSNPVDQHELGRCLLDCPVPELRDSAEALRIAQACIDAVPDNPRFMKLWGDAEKASQSPRQ